MKVAILTEGSAEIGFGHITRCSALYETFEAHGDEPLLILNGDQIAADLVADKRSQVFDWMKDDARFFQCAAGAEMVIIDSYLAGPEFYRALSERVPCAVYVDDIQRLSYPKGIVLNGSILSERLDYPKKEGVRYLCGADYAFLRKEFRDATEKYIAPAVKTILVTFGGEDIRQMTGLVVAAIGAAYPAVALSVVIGKGFKGADTMTYATGGMVTMARFPDASCMRNLMEQADIAISAGGQTLYELARIGVPTVGIGVAENQKTNLAGWADSGFMRFAGWYDDPRIVPNICAAVKELIPPEVRRRCSAAGQRIMDGKSHERLYRILVGEMLSRSKETMR
jgi:spore coat polysaccharide biosynthesis predicted glycosyltransferase SpsG